MLKYKLRLLGESGFNLKDLSEFEGGIFSQEQIEDIREGLYLENEGWRFVVSHEDYTSFSRYDLADSTFHRIKSPSGKKYSTAELSSAKGLKFGDKKSIERLTASRYLLICKTYVHPEFFESAFF